jgi:hypothetical protein
MSFVPDLKPSVPDLETANWTHEIKQQIETEHPDLPIGLLFATTDALRTVLEKQGAKKGTLPAPEITTRWVASARRVYRDALANYRGNQHSALEHVQGILNSLASAQ